jgi:competence protein ComEA
MRTISAVLVAGLLMAVSHGAWADRVNINEADAATLAGLNGIGRARAEAIIEYRKVNGPFGSVDDLAKVKGVGPAFVERNRDQLTVGDEKDPRRGAAAVSQ